MIRMTRVRRAAVSGALCGVAVLTVILGTHRPVASADAPRFITLASTTSTEGSGLLAALLPRFTAESGVEVRVVAVGTGQALKLGRRGDVDALLVHDTAAELAFVAEGFGSRRETVMSNDFVLVGPETDPAAVRGQRDIAAALRRIAAREQIFVSRGDDSGTHRAELRLWALAEFDPRPASGSWYREVGQGMGATLNTASAMGAHTLTDRASWLRSKNRRGLEILVEGDDRLANVYGALLVSATRHPHVKQADADRLIDWLISERGQRAIAGFEIGGEQAFAPHRPVPTVAAER